MMLKKMPGPLSLIGQLSRDVIGYKTQANLTNQIQRIRLIKSSTDDYFSRTLKIFSAQVFETSVQTNSVILPRRSQYTI